MKQVKQYQLDLKIAPIGFTYATAPKESEFICSTPPHKGKKRPVGRKKRQQRIACLKASS